MKHAPYESKKIALNALKKGYTIAEVADLTGFSSRTISRWKKLEKEEPERLKEITPGRGRPTILSEKEVSELLECVEKPASEFGFPTDLWTLERMQSLCKQKFSKMLSEATFSRLLKKCQYSCRKPVRQYYEADPKEQERWVKEDLRKAKQWAKKKGAKLYCMDEASIQLTPVLGTTWGKKGTTTKQRVTGNRGSVSCISAISPKGDLVSEAHKKAKRFRSEDIISFYKKLLKRNPRKHILVINDRAPCHMSKKVAEFIKSVPRLRVLALPPRSPQYNPDEKVWHYLKHYELKSHQFKTVDELYHATKQRLKKLSKNKKKIIGIFNRCEMAHLYLFGRDK